MNPTSSLQDGNFSSCRILILNIYALLELQQYFYKSFCISKEYTFWYICLILRKSLAYLTACRFSHLSLWTDTPIASGPVKENIKSTFRNRIHTISSFLNDSWGDQGPAQSCQHNLIIAADCNEPVVQSLFYLPECRPYDQINRSFKEHCILSQGKSPLLVFSMKVDESHHTTAASALISKVISNINVGIALTQEPWAYWI